MERVGHCVCALFKHAKREFLDVICELVIRFS